MKTATKTVTTPAEPPSNENMRLEDRIMARALALWHGREYGRRNALDAWLQAEREVLAQKNALPDH